MNSISKLLMTTAFALSSMSLAHAGQGHHPSESAKPADATVAQSGAEMKKVDMTEGEIKKVDKATGKLTIKHGELKNLEMPAMTMVFQVKDKSVLDRVKSGDKINFVAEKLDGKFTVTQLEAAQ